MNHLLGKSNIYFKYFKNLPIIFVKINLRAHLIGGRDENGGRWPVHYLIRKEESRNERGGGRGCLSLTQSNYAHI